MDTKQTHKLRKFIKELASIRGRHTELISVYVPAGYDINKIIQHMEEEQGTASNIKDKTTRTHVIDSLERAIRHLRLFKKTPENGIAVFSGNASERDNVVDIKVWSLETPDPLKFRLYRCDQTFVLDPLKEMLEHKETYGLIVLDRREATIGLLKGTSISQLINITSGVPGKTQAGGQCLTQDTLIMLSDGEIIKVQDAHNSLKIISCKLNEQKISQTNIREKWDNKKKVFRIITKYPRTTIDASSDHTFFVRTDKGIEEKPLSEIKEGDYLIMPEKINLNLKDQKLNFVPNIKRKEYMKTVKIPKKINKDFSRLLGYYLGDGNYEIDRITFSEQNKDVTNYYQNLIKKVFGIESKVNFRKNKGYYQMRVYSRIISQLFKNIFQINKKTLNEQVPSIILKSSNKSLASFIAGFFDAEGYVSSNRVALGINNKIIVRQLQLALLRFGIISSVNEYDNRRNPYSKKIRYTLAIDDVESLKKFMKYINLSSKEKKNKLQEILAKRGNRSNVRQILINGKEIRDLFKRYNHNVYHFGFGGFFSNQRQLNKELFKKRLIDNVNVPEIKRDLLKYYNSELIPVKIKKIEYLGKEKTIDLETSSHNFIANCLLVHNSAHRYERIREGMTKEFFVRIGELANKYFLDIKTTLKGILIGGPGPTKEEFFAGDYLNNEIKQKVLALQDQTYTDETGLHDLVEKSKEILAKEIIIKEKQLMQKFFEMLAKTPEKVSYGLNETKKALDFAAVDTLLLSDDLEESIIEEFIAKAESTNAKVELISTETREGQQLRDLGGIGAILRYAFQ